MRKRHTAGEIVELLRVVEDLLRSGATLVEAAQAIGVNYNTAYHWRRKYSDLTISGLELLRSLEAENARLRRSLLELEKR